MEDLILNNLGRILLAMVPLLLATTGAILAERSGVLNLGIEGMMAVGTLAAFVTYYTTGILLVAVVAAIVASALLAGVHAVTSVWLRANQTVSGLALTMLGVGLASVLGKPFVGKSIAGEHEPNWTFGLGDVPWLGRILGELDGFFWFSLLLAAAAWFFLQKTRGGLLLRTVGENPKAAESLGVSAAGVRFWAVLAGGAFSGLAGAYLALSANSSWNENMVGGRGWIVVALTIFALWNPLRAIGGAMLFGAAFVLRYTLQDFVPLSLLEMLPFAATLGVLIFDGLNRDHRKLHAPAALGEPYRRGER